MRHFCDLKISRFFRKMNKALGVRSHSIYHFSSRLGTKIN